MNNNYNDLSDVKSNLTELLTWTEATDFNDAYTKATYEVKVILTALSPNTVGSVFDFPKSYLSNLTEDTTFTNGYYYSSTSYGLIQIVISYSDMTAICNLYKNGTIITSGRQFKFYYR